MITGFRAYTLYLAVQRHFAIGSYNGFKYNFRVKVPVATYEKRKDRFVFEKLANKYISEDQLINFYVANTLAGISYAGSMTEPPFSEWKGKMSNLSYNYGVDMKKVFCYTSSCDYQQLTNNIDGTYPIILRLLMMEQIRIESVIVFDHLTGFLGNCPEYDRLIWPELKNKLEAYSPFIKVSDKKKAELIRTTAKIIEESKQAPIS